MSVENDSVEKEPEAEERREPNAPRVPYEGLVELGGALGPAFEAQAVDVSRGGMHLRTAYLPEVGQPLTCRFDAGNGEVLASGDVVWRHEEGRGGEFAIRFSPLDAESAEALGRVVGAPEPFASTEPGARVRLHIDGLGAPMRARVKGACASELTVGSDLGFLQVGKSLELEDANTGGKRAARIDRVSVEVDEVSKIPQLVVTLRYDEPLQGVELAAAEPARAGSKPDRTPEPSVIDEEAKARAAALEAEDTDFIEGLEAGMKGAFARGAAQVGPAMGKLLNRAKTTLALLAARAKAADDSAAPARRTTAPAPGGGLHASGRRVVRSEPAVEPNGVAPDAFRGFRRAGLAGAVLCAALILFLALRKPKAQLTTASIADTAPTQGTSAPPAPTGTAPAAADNAAEPALGAQPPASSQLEGTPTPAATASDDTERTHRRAVHATPFGNGAVSHGNVLRLKMDGVIEKIEGATLPTGFTVVLPDRRSLEAAAPLASRDSRIGSIRVTNDAHGAELTVAFKDGVPNYQVRAKGETLEIVLATPGKVIESEPLTKPVAKKAHHVVRDKN